MLTEFIGWVLNTLTTAAEAEMNDDSALREQLLDAEMRREMGEISDEEFEQIEADLVARIREIKERQGGSGPISMGGEPIETTADSRFQVEASVSWDFHEPAEAPHTTVVEMEPGSGETISVLDIEPGPADRRRAHSRSVRATATTRTIRTARTARTDRTDRTTRRDRTTRATRTKRS